MTTRAGMPICERCGGEWPHLTDGLCSPCVIHDVMSADRSATMVIYDDPPPAVRPNRERVIAAYEEVFRR